MNRNIKTAGRKNRHSYSHSPKGVFRLLLICCMLLCAVRGEAFSDDRAIRQQVIIRYDNYSEICFDPIEQTTAILSYSCEIPYVLIDSNPTAEEAINTVLKQYHDKYVSASEGVSTSIDMETYMLAQAEDHYTLMYVQKDKEREENSPLTDNVLFSFSHKAYVTRCDDALLVFNFVDYTGTPMGSETKNDVLVFNAGTGAQIDPNTENISDSVLFPAPVRRGEGSCYLATAAQLAEDPLSESERVIDLLETDPTGEEYYLRVTGELYDLRFATVVYYDRCYEKEQLWYCNCMNNEAVQLKLRLPENAPELKLSFASPSYTTETGAYVLANDPDRGGLTLRPPELR